MTHDELLAKLNEYQPIIREDIFDKDIFGQWRNALRRVVKLPQETDWDGGWEDADAFQYGYKLAMTQVIQAIEKELK